MEQNKKQKATTPWDDVFTIAKLTDEVVLKPDGDEANISIFKILGLEIDVILIEEKENYIDIRCVSEPNKYINGRIYYTAHVYLKNSSSYKKSTGFDIDGGIFSSDSLIKFDDSFEDIKFIVVEATYTRKDTNPPPPPSPYYSPRSPSPSM